MNTGKESVEFVFSQVGSGIRLFRSSGTKIKTVVVVTMAIEYGTALAVGFILGRVL